MQPATAYKKAIKTFMCCLQRSFESKYGSHHKSETICLVNSAKMDILCVNVCLSCVGHTGSRVAGTFYLGFRIPLEGSNVTAGL